MITVNITAISSTLSITLGLLLALFASVEIDDAKQVERLLQVKKVPPNTRNQNGYAPLHIAAEKGSSASIQVLAKAEDISIDIFSEEDGKTPLHLAAMNKRHNCVEALLANNANPHTLDKAEGYSALHWAAKAGK
jgi:ankyrin repeat protein